ncbi:MAG TPA: hypothetical protein VKR82_01130 [Candidatus Acidoferrales bacterium]|nr:hypothetical protein [Candidatus Acidoferrales bacterium]
MNACTEWKDKLTGMAAGGIGEAETRGVELHMKDCAGCAEAFVELRTRAMRLDAALPLLSDGAEVSPGFEARLMARIASRGGPRGRAPSWPGWWPRLAAAGVVCTVIVAGMASSGVNRMVREWWRGEPEVSISMWRSPTESLLSAPGQDLLRSGPKLGEVYFPVQPAVRGTIK